MIWVKRSVLFVILLVSYLYAVCCDCGRGRISVKDFNSNDWIFIGTLLRENTSNQHTHRNCIYKIITAYKGAVEGDTIQICDAEDVGACGLGKLTIGADYLIYASGNSEKWTSRCLGNSRVPIFILPRDSTAINNLITGRYRGGMDDTINNTFHTDNQFLNTHIPKVSKNTMQKFYDKDGKISAEGRYKDGLPDGLWQYYEHGELVEYGKYLNGKKDSLWVRQYGTSKDIEEYKDGEYTYRHTTFYDGNVYSKKEPVSDGKKWICSMYHDNGRPRYIAYTNPPKRNEEGRLKDPVWDGPYKTFNKAGVVLDEGLHENGFRIGHWKYYYEDGKLRMEGDYIDGKKSGTWKIYYPDKKIKAIGEYKSDEKVGEWRYYNVKGKEIPPNPELIQEDEDWFTYTGVKR